MAQEKIVKKIKKLRIVYRVNHSAGAAPTRQ